MAAGAPRKRAYNSGGQGDSKAVSYDDIVLAIEKRLFLARLPPTVTEEELREVYEAYGELTECRIVPGKNVAFVGFNTWSAAQKALNETDDQRQLKGHREGQYLSVSFAEKTKVVGHGGGQHLSKGLQNSRVFVGSLPEAITDDELREVFDPFGEVQGANLLPAKGSKRCGFVNFTLWGEALDAVEEMNGKALRAGGPEITVKMADPGPGFGGGKGGRASSENGGSGGKGGDRYNAFGSGSWGRDNSPSADDAGEAPWKRRRGADGGGRPAMLSLSNRKAEFDSLFVQYRVAVDREQSSDEQCEQLHRSLMDLRAAIFGASEGRCARSRSRSGQPPRVSLRQARSQADDDEEASEEDEEDDADAEGARLYVSGLPKECDDEVLRALVEQLKFRCYFKDAEILECHVLACKGCGYVSFRSREAAEEALEQLDDRHVSGWPKKLRARWAAEPASQGAPKRRTDSRDDPRRKRRRPRSDASSRESDEESERPDGEREGGYDESWKDYRRGAGAGRWSRQGQADHGAGDDLDRCRLFVGQLRSGLSEVDVSDVFRPYGKIEECRVLFDKGVAYVTFSDESDAAEARKALDGRPVSGISRGEGLNVQIAKRRPGR